MKVVLLERVENLGAMGDVVRVRNGYARNFLLPQHKALRATDANLARFEREREALEARNAERRTDAEKAASTVDGTSVVLIRQAGESGQLYGSVTSRDIADAVSTEAVAVSRAQVALNAPIKALGLHEVRIRLHPEVAVTVTVNVARSSEEAERQARGEDVIATQHDEDRAIAEAQAAALFEAGAEPDELAEAPADEAGDTDEDGAEKA
ncbi:MAG: 50S ribosomal protein L9 [Maricaulaceae bacterium]|nr:50S ribosomal protein L9 [Maricaulaceae bacterium]